MHLLLLSSILAGSLVGAPLEPALPARAAFDALDTSGDGQELAKGELANTPGDYAWGEAYLLAAYVEMYEATGETRYLDKLASRFRVLLSLRDDKQGKVDELRGKPMAAWGTTRYSGGKRACWNVHAGMLAAPAARFVRLVSTQKALAGRYDKTALEFRAALEETVATYAPEWRDGPEADEGHYVGPELEGKHLPLNQQNALGWVLLDLSAATGNKAYREQAAKLACFLKRRLRLREDLDAWDWSYWPALQPPYAKGSEDISHAAINADFAVRCYQDGAVFSREDIQRFANTFLKAVRRPEGGFANTVAGGGKDTYALQAGRWGRLACVDPQVATVIHGYFYKLDPPHKGQTSLLALALLAHSEAGWKTH